MFIASLGRMIGVCSVSTVKTISTYYGTLKQWNIVQSFKGLIK